MIIPIRPRRPALWVLALLLVAAAGCGGGEEVTKESIARARRLWSKAGIRDYDLEWISSGSSSSHYRVSVRNGGVRTIESVQSTGQTVPVRTAEPRYYGVEGLFMIIADELAQRQMPRPFGQPKGTTAILRFTPDAKLGIPMSYRRDVMGAPMPLAIDVVRFDPHPRASPSPPPS
jgi:hypothetical protein